MQTAFFDGQVGLAVCGRVMAGFWRAPFSHERLRKLREVAAEMRARELGTLGMIAVFESDAIQLGVLSNQALRNDAANLQRELVDKFTGGQCFVLEGSGFAVAALRATAIAVQAVSRVNTKYVFQTEAHAGVDWLSAQMKLTPAETLDVARAIQDLREKTRSAEALSGHG